MNCSVLTSSVFVSLNTNEDDLFYTHQCGIWCSYFNFYESNVKLITLIWQYLLAFSIAKTKCVSSTGACLTPLGSVWHLVLWFASLLPSLCSLAPWFLFSPCGPILIRVFLHTSSGLQLNLTLLLILLGLLCMALSCGATLTTLACWPPSPNDFLGSWEIRNANLGTEWVLSPWISSETS